ncbi:MAG: reverse transcriptase family protein, partial [Nitrosomonadaceae bacterium]
MESWPAPYCQGSIKLRTSLRDGRRKRGKKKDLPEKEYPDYRTGYNQDELLVTVSAHCADISLETKYSVMQQAVATCPAVCLKVGEQLIPSLLDSGSQVTLLRESYFREYILPLVEYPKGEKSMAHELFNITGISEASITALNYFEIDFEFLGLKVPKVGCLIIPDFRRFLPEKDRGTKLAGVVGWNLIRLGFDEFVKQHGLKAFEESTCPQGVNPLLFAQLCVYYCTEKAKESPDSPFAGIATTFGVMSTYKVTEEAPKAPSSTKKKLQKTDVYLDGYLGTVSIGNKRQPICIPGSSSLTVEGKTNKILPNKACLVEEAENNNLPLGIVVNRTFVTTKKSRQVAVILCNTNNYNVWLRQPYFAAEVYDVDHHEWEQEVVILRDDEVENQVRVGFRPVASKFIQAELLAAEAKEAKKAQKKAEKAKKEEGKGGVGVETSATTSAETEVKDPVAGDSSSEDKPCFGLRPDTSSPDFDFDAEVKRLPFKFNLSEVGIHALSAEQKARLINIIYDFQPVFSLHDEDLGYCEKVKHTIPTTTDKPVYLPHRTIPVQLQGEVRKCLDTWLRQGIIRPSKSPYASQVVIVRKKSGEIRLCVDFRKLNSISTRDSFPLPRVEEALQAVQSAFWFTCFDLAQGYLQLAMEEADIPKTAF